MDRHPTAVTMPQSKARTERQEQAAKITRSLLEKAENRRQERISREQPSRPEKSLIVLL